MQDFRDPDKMPDMSTLARQIKIWGQELGFQGVAISGTELGEAQARLIGWLGKGYHGDMDFMARHASLRARPAELHPGTLRIITVRMNYRPPRTRDSWQVLNEPETAHIARYALGRDYHKVLRKRLQQLAGRIQEIIGPFSYRAFTDSAPVMEVELAQQAGLGWRGKHTLLLNRESGSWFFLGELFTDLPLPVDPSGGNYCGSCQRCIDICPTQAIVAPYELDARRCISYLTIEHKGSIPEALRPLIGNRIYGCDDCQLVCPWNKFAQDSMEADFSVRHRLDSASLRDLFLWNEAEFHERLAGSAIHRIGHERWLRNLAVGLGNAPSSPQIIQALQARSGHPSALVREHVDWALSRHRG